MEYGLDKTVGQFQNYANGQSYGTNLISQGTANAYIQRGTDNAHKKNAAYSCESGAKTEAAIAGMTNSINSAKDSANKKIQDNIRREEERLAAGTSTNKKRLSNDEKFTSLMSKAATYYEYAALICGSDKSYEQAAKNGTLSKKLEDGRKQALVKVAAGIGSETDKQIVSYRPVPTPLTRTDTDYISEYLISKATKEVGGMKYTYYEERENWVASAKVGSDYTPMVGGMVLAGSAAVVDGPIPIGDIIGILILGTVVVYELLQPTTVAQTRSVPIEIELSFPKVKTKFAPPPSTDTAIFRYGGTSPGNLTPSPRDVDLFPTTKRGLSFSTIPKPGAAMTTMGAVDATPVLYTVKDGLTHVSIFPVGITLADWRAHGSESIWTQALKAICVKIPG